MSDDSEDSVKKNAKKKGAAYVNATAEALAALESTEQTAPATTPPPAGADKSPPPRPATEVIGPGRDTQSEVFKTQLAGLLRDAATAEKNGNNTFAAKLRARAEAMTKQFGPAE